jgi:addiction module RelE/StbE family toxin
MRRFGVASGKGRSVELEWTPEAVSDLGKAEAFIAAEKPSAAMATVNRVFDAVEYLLSYPNLGRPGRTQGPRELMIPGLPFIVVYRIRTDRIELLRLLHHARRWPPT